MDHAQVDTVMYDPSRVQTKRNSSDADTGGESKKRRVEVMSVSFSVDVVEKYLRELKTKQLELLLDLNMENFFLGSGGNIMDLSMWKKRPATALLRQYVIENCGHELEAFLSSKLPPESILSKAVSHTTPDSVSAQSIPTPHSSRSANHVTEQPEIKNATPRARSASSNFSKVSTVVNSSAPSAYASRPHGTRQKSISVAYETSIGSQEQIVERAKQEAHVMQRIAELRKEGLWSAKKLPKVQEAPRVKAHWDYLLEEMQWLATDFGHERKWKKAAAKKCARMIAKYWLDKEQKKEKEKRDEIARMRKIASTISKEVRTFWESAEKLVSFKQQTRLEKKRKQALDMHLNFIVGQTEQYTEWLTEGLKSNTNSEAASHVDSEFVPDSDDVLSDDEETIAKEEKENDPIGDKSELELLQQDMQMPFDEFLQSLPPQVLEKPASIQGSEDGESESFVSDGDYKGEESEPDQEDTIAEQEAVEDAAIDYQAELKELEDDANLTREELMKKYSIPMPDESMDSTICDERESNEETEDEVTEEDLSACDEDEEIGLEFLAEVGSQKPDTSKDGKVKPSREISDIAAGAEEIQPKGNTLSTAKVVTKVPFLLKHSLREYQHIGLDWLVAMYEKKLNGILADEMGLGKTIQTIALLAHLACEKGIWGPHLIVVPTSVMLNWEMEIKKWCPAFKTLTYYGSPKERKAKRQGWTKPNQFHICITSYKLVVQDHQSFRRKKWRYLILDEAQHIKNFKSQRWQMLLNFNTSRRLLLTGTPLQNNLMELWSLMHFLMPNVFASHRDFKDWFVNPVTGMIEGNQEYNEELVRRLHKILRPFLLRRLKKDVEKQLPQKHEHVIMCRLSKRQRYLYEEYMSLSKTKETLATGNFLSVINVLMQLRKVCNHPDLFETRPIISPFTMEGLVFQTSSLITKANLHDPFSHIDLSSTSLDLIGNSLQLTASSHHRINTFKATPSMIEQIDSLPDAPPRIPRGKIRLQITTKNTGLKQPPSASLAPIGPTIVIPVSHSSSVRMTNSVVHPSGCESSVLKKLTLTEQDASGSQRVKIPMGNLHVSPTGHHHLELSPVARRSGCRVAAPAMKRKLASPFDDQHLCSKKEDYRRDNLQFLGKLNETRCDSSPIYPRDLVEAFTLTTAVVTSSSPCFAGQGLYYCQNCLDAVNCQNQADGLCQLLHNPQKIIDSMEDDLDRFVIRVPPVSTTSIKMHTSHPDPSSKRQEDLFEYEMEGKLLLPSRILHKPFSNMMTQFPELRLIQYDCGKLQTLDILLCKLKSGGHRVLIFTQMSRMLDIFEQFLNYHGHTYLRLDGATKIEQRQSLMERFNADSKIFCFILSTRSGGVGVNLTGADTVIFYDSDWNPTMDAQAQDRCHRIGQTRDVHIYRLVSERTVEENILRKAQQKKLLGDLAIEEGNFTTAFFKDSALRELFGETVKGRGNDLRDMVAQEPKGLEDVAVSTKVWEAGLESVEEQTDVVAAKTSKAEANAELAEFDENVPLDTEITEGDDKTPAEDELEQLVAVLTPIEKFALKYLESNQDEATVEYLKAAEEEIEQNKKDWEMEHMKNLKEAERAAAEEENSDVEAHLTISRQDVYNQVYFDGDEVMPLWTPPTPPQDNSDVYVDHCMAFLYEQSLMAESELPPVYIPKAAKRLKLDNISTVRSKQRVKRDDVTIPRSLFDRPPMAILKLRRELKSLKLRGHLVGGPDVLLLQKILNQLGPNLSITPPMTLLSQAQNSKSPQLLLAGLQQENQPEWTIGEEYATLQAIQQIQELPTNLVVVSPAHTPNWDLVSDFVSSSSLSYRSPRICRHHYESVVVPREEGKGLQVLQDHMVKKNKKQKLGISQTGETLPTSPSPPKVKPIRTTVLFRQDDNLSSSKNCNFRFETIHAFANKRAAAARPVFVAGIGKCNPKHISLLSENGISHDTPLTPMEIAVNRQERLAKEKAKSQQIQADIVRQKQLQQKLVQQHHLKAQQMAMQQSPIRPQAFSPSPSVPPPVLANRSVPPVMTPTPPTRNQEVEQLAQQLSQAAANFTAATQAQQAQMASNIARPAMNPEQGIVGGVVSFQPQPQSVHCAIPGKPVMAQQHVQALNRGQAVVRARPIQQAQIQGQTVQLHQLPTPTRLQIAATGVQQISMPTSLPISSSHTSTIVSSSMQVTAGQRILTATKSGQPYIATTSRQAELQHILGPRSQIPGQTARLPNLGQILQLHPVQTSTAPAMAGPSIAPSPILRNVVPQSAITSTPQTLTIPISVSGMNIISSHQAKHPQVPPSYQMKQIPLSMVSTRRVPATTQVALQTGQQINPISVSASQVVMQQHPITSQGLATMASTTSGKPVPQQKGAQYGTIQILQSSSPGQKLQIQQLQQIIKSGGLVLQGSSNMAPGSSNLVLRPTTSGETGMAAQTSISLTHQQLQQLKMIPSTQSSNIAKNIVVTSQQMPGTPMQAQTPFTLAIRTNPPNQTISSQVSQESSHETMEPTPPRSQEHPPPDSSN